MKMLKYSALFLLFAAVITLNSCSSDDPAPVEGKDGIIEDMDDPDLIVDDLQGEITGDITLAASKNWILTGALIVADGGKLTIEAGTTIKAEAGGTDVYIAVERNGEIQAVGTATAPIKITSNAASPASGRASGCSPTNCSPASCFAGWRPRYR